MQVGPKMAEVATKTAILASFLELSLMMFRLLSPIFAEMGEVEKRTTVERFWWIFRIWSIAWMLLDAILEEIWSNWRSHLRSCSYDLSFLATCYQIGELIVARMIQIRVLKQEVPGWVGGNRTGLGAY